MDRTVSFKILSSPATLPEPPAAVPRPSVHWRESYFDTNKKETQSANVCDAKDKNENAQHSHVVLGDDEVRKELWTTKALLDTVPEALYYKARNDVFPLAVGGAQGSNTFFNRAGHKLNEVMEVTGIWSNFTRSAGNVVGSSGVAVPAPAEKDEAAALPSGSAPTDEKSDEAATSGVDAAPNVSPLPMPKKGGSNVTNVRGRTAFVDLCGGPGSFAQAIFGAYPRRSKVKLVGFGMTLKDPNMADKHNTAADGWYPNLVENKNFHPTFGVNGEGDIYKMSNIHALASQTEGFPMLLAVADGGFEVPSADANFQETISMRLAFAQWHAALCVLQPGGAFVLKLFDTFSPVMRSMLYLTTKFFDSTFIVKPKHSRAVNSERYLAAKGFKGIPTRKWKEYLEALHAGGFTDDGFLVGSLVPESWWSGEGPFESSVVAMNKAIANNQIEAIKKVMAHESIRRHLGLCEPTTTSAESGDVVGVKRGREDDSASPRAASDAAVEGVMFASSVLVDGAVAQSVVAVGLEDNDTDGFVVAFE